MSSRIAWWTTELGPSKKGDSRQPYFPLTCVYFLRLGWLVGDWGCLRVSIAVKRHHEQGNSSWEGWADSMAGFKFSVRRLDLSLCFQELGKSRQVQASEAALPPGLRQGQWVSSSFQTFSATSSALVSRLPSKFLPQNFLVCFKSGLWAHLGVSLSW